MDTKIKDKEAKDKKDKTTAARKAKSSEEASSRMHKVATDEQAATQAEYETNAGQAGTRMGERPAESGSDKPEQPNRQRSSQRSSGQTGEDQGTPRGSWQSDQNKSDKNKNSESDIITGETGRRYDRDDDYHRRYSDYERGFREGSDHASRWHNQRNFERERHQNRFGEYNEGYNPTGINTGRYGSYNRGYGYNDYDDQGLRSNENTYRTRAGNYDRSFEDRNYINRNIGYENRGYGRGYDRGQEYYRGYSDPGYYQGAAQSYPNQDRYDTEYGYNELQGRRDRDYQRQNYYDPNQGGYSYGGYGGQSGRGSQEERLEGPRGQRGHRHGASPADYEDARNYQNEFGNRNNYEGTDRNRSSISSRYDRDRERELGRRGEDSDYRRKKDQYDHKEAENRYDDPYREYDW